MLPMLRIALLATFLAVVVSTHEDDVHTVQYDTDNFVEEVGKKNHFVMFYAPWCGHCKRLAPTWEQLAEMLNEEDSNVRIAKVDCTTDNTVCSDNDVTGYPTLKFFKVGESEGVKFKGSRDLPSLTTFINDQLNLGGSDDTPSDGPQVINGLADLTEDTFDKFVASGKNFVKFYAPWCGHCQKLAPVWEELAQTYQSKSNVGIAKVDCTQHKSVCNQFDVKGYPTLLWIEDGKKVDKYQGQRAHDQLKIYVNRMLSTTGDASNEVNSNDSEDSENASPVVVLSGEDFDQGIESGVSFIKFFAPWCGHCKRLAPTWDELGKKFLDNDGVNIVKVDCTLDANKKLCNDQEVEGFPTVFLYKNGKKISEYNGNRSLQDMYDFVVKHTGHDEL